MRHKTDLLGGPLVRAGETSRRLWLTKLWQERRCGGSKAHSESVLEAGEFDYAADLYATLRGPGFKTTCGEATIRNQNTGHVSGIFLPAPFYL